MQGRAGAAAPRPVVSRDQSGVGCHGWAGRRADGYVVFHIAPEFS